MSQGNQRHSQSQPKQNPSEPSTNPIPEGMDQTKDGAKKTEEKKGGGVIDLVTSIPKAIWNKGVLPFYDFLKGSAGRIYGWIKSNYQAELKLYKDIGPAKYVLDRGSKALIKVLKVAAIVTVAGLINTLLVNMTGISLFDPMTLAFVAVGALLLMVAKSYMDQKAVTDKFSFTAMGHHIVENVAAA